MKIELSKKMLLRMFLVYSALGWGICIVWVFLPGDSAFEILGYIGGISPEVLNADPMYDYWLRMASSVFAFLGFLYLLPVMNPAKFAALAPYLGWFMIIEGAVLFAHGAILGLPATPWLGDVGFCVVGGIGILSTMKSPEKHVRSSL
ncbi:MAG: hypothetical protein GXP32_07125 [Kiritimatiellaeota bacterium]|nr:hypothetical protein [Kiritimatiellota bacterium]